MAESTVIDLRDRKNPPPDDPEKAPYGYRWDTKKREWTVKRSAGGRKAGAAWFGSKNVPEEMEPFEQQFGPADADPEPSYIHAPTIKKPTPRVTKKVKDDIEGALGLVGMLLIPLANADPYCGGALAENYPKIVEALVPLMCKSPAVVAFMTSGDGNWMLWVQLMMAVAPVAVAVGRHHITKTVELVQNEEGEVFVQPRDLSEYTS